MDRRTEGRVEPIRIGGTGCGWLRDKPVSSEGPARPIQARVPFGRRPSFLTCLPLAQPRLSPPYPDRLLTESVTLLPERRSKRRREQLFGFDGEGGPERCASLWWGWFALRRWRLRR